MPLCVPPTELVESLCDDKNPNMSFRLSTDADGAVQLHPNGLGLLDEATFIFSFWTFLHVVLSDYAVEAARRKAVKPGPKESQLMM